MQGDGDLAVYLGARGAAPSALLASPTSPTFAFELLNNVAEPRVVVGPDMNGDGVDDLLYATRGLGTFVHSLPRPRAGFDVWPAAPAR